MNTKHKVFSVNVELGLKGCDIDLFYMKRLKENWEKNNLDRKILSTWNVCSIGGWSHAYKKNETVSKI